MRVTDILTPNTVKVFLEKSEKRSVIEELVDFALEHRPREERKKIVDDLCARENETPTGVGEGIAVPHGQIDGEELIVAVGLSRSDLDFESLDDKPVRLVFLVLGPAAHPGKKLRFLARISRLLHNRELRKELFAAQSSQEIHEAFRAYEVLHFG